MSTAHLNHTVALAMALMAIIVMMILPMPAIVLDIGLALSFSLAILIFTITLFAQNALEFSSFPTVLLASLMLRLSLNVSSTKLIIGEGHTGTAAAGQVIEGIANFVMGGSVFLGLVVFCVLLIVNFMVITKGAARMAEVGARFALDGMPGKQLAIDSDVAAGAIDHAEAKRRRELDQKETTFLGSLDGASKFVKGDAIAGLLITILNLVMGLLMGMAVHGMPFQDAIETYSILTVGDGLVSQLPSVIISVAAALLLARGGATGSTDMALVEQFSRYPAALVTVGALMLVFALVPGLPFVPFLGGAVVLIGMAWLARKKQSAEVEVVDGEPEDEPLAAEPAMADILEIDDIHIQFAPDLVDLVLDPGTGLDARIKNMRKHVAQEFGVILPEIRLTDDAALPSGRYVINVFGVEAANGDILPHKMLALLEGPNEMTETISEPVYGAPAIWVDQDQQEALALKGQTVVLPCEILATHLLECLKQNLGCLLTYKSLQRLLAEMGKVSDPARAEANRKLLQELIPDKVPTELLHSVLLLLLNEQVSIRNLGLIIETLSKARNLTASPEALCELVRQGLGFQITAAVKRVDGTVPLIHLAPEWEERFATYQIENETGLPNVALPADMAQKLVEATAQSLSDAADRGETLAIVTSVQRRRFLRTLLAGRGIQTPVLSFEEIGHTANPSVVGVVGP